MFDKLIALLMILFLSSCADTEKNDITDVRISYPGQDISNVALAINSAHVNNIKIRYSMVGKKDSRVDSQMSEQKRNHRFLLTNLNPGQKYVFNITTSGTRTGTTSVGYSFKTIDFPDGKKYKFHVECAAPSALPENFKQGYVMIHRREDPGIILLFDHRGNIVWFYQARNVGIKVVNFTNNQTFLCLLGSREFETGYGSAILELSLSGDTLLYLKKGQNDFRQTIHHEIILNAQNEIVTLNVEDRIFDLRSKGGSANDTVRGDGIMVLDRKGKLKWKWTVFDELDPLKDSAILSTRRDWMHANSVSFDKEGNYLISFYNNGQIWKVDAKTGRVIWKFGKNGDFQIPRMAEFDQAHAVHINDRGLMMFFDNGANIKRSRTLAFSLNEKERKAHVVINTWLPPQLFTERMGSGYLVDDTTLLQCSSRHKTVVLTDLKGKFLWQLKADQLVSYRAEFLSGEKLTPDMLKKNF